MRSLQNLATRAVRRKTTYNIESVQSLTNFLSMSSNSDTLTVTGITISILIGAATIWKLTRKSANIVDSCISVGTHDAKLGVEKNVPVQSTAESFSTAVNQSVSCVGQVHPASMLPANKGN